MAEFKPLTKADHDAFLKRLKDVKEMRDVELAHEEADAVLLEALELCGYTDLVKAYEKIGKYYA